MQFSPNIDMYEGDSFWVDVSDGGEMNCNASGCFQSGCGYLDMNNGGPILADSCEEEMKALCMSECPNRSSLFEGTASSSPDTATEQTLRYFKLL